MATINKKFYNNETEYSDGSIEDEILNMVKNTDDLEGILINDTRWPVFYHLSYLRENLLNWYPFKEDSNLLEIGAGCGALTGLFCNKVSKVTAVELTDRRSQIIYNRHKNYSNLEIFPGNLNNMEFEEKFDYIILCGVLEYATRFTPTDKPHVDFLKKIKSMLSENGVILVAIENRIGLKYFSGSKEDHVGKGFVGIDNYPNNDNVKTFSRFEIEEVIKEAGFNNYKFFYPYPDYKFPTIIHTDDLIEEIPVLTNAPNHDYQKIKLFNEGNLNLTLSKDNISKYFANSFLVELRNSNDTQQSENVKYSKLSARREKEFRIGTQIYQKDDEILVSKFPLNSTSEKHVEKMHNYSKNDFGKIKCLNSVLENKNLVYHYLDELNLSNILTDLLLKDPTKKQAIDELKNIYDAIEFNSSENDNYHTSEFSAVFGDEQIDEAMHCHEISNLDFIFNNLFYVNDEIIAIDYEWCFDFPIPVEYIFWRSLNFEYYHNDIFKKLLTIEEIFDDLKLNKEWIPTFKKWENHFMKYVGGPVLPKQKIITGEQILHDLKHYKKLAKDKEKEIKKLKKQNKKLKKNNSKLEDKLKIMEESTSWKITSPLRNVMKK